MLLCAMFLAIGFTSCGDDDDNDEPSDSLVGTWLSKQIEHGEVWYVQLNFKSNGTVDYKEWVEGDSDYDDAYSGKWSTAGDVLTVKWTDDYDGETWTEAYRFSINGNKMMLYEYSDTEGELFIRQ